MNIDTVWLQQRGYVLDGDTARRPATPPPEKAVVHPRPRRCPTEDEEQASLMAWADAMVVSGLEPRLEWLYAMPNGGKRPKATAGRLKAMGTKPGIPDLMLPVPLHGHHGCYVELKALDGTTTETQQRWLSYLARHGYCAGIYKGWVAAAQHLCGYLDRPDLAKMLGEVPYGVK